MRDPHRNVRLQRQTYQRLVRFLRTYYAVPVKLTVLPTHVDRWFRRTHRSRLTMTYQGLDYAIELSVYSGEVHLRAGGKFLRVCLPRTGSRKALQGAFAFICAHGPTEESRTRVAQAEALRMELARTAKLQKAAKARAHARLKSALEATGTTEQVRFRGVKGETVSEIVLKGPWTTKAGIRSVLERLSVVLGEGPVQKARHDK